MVYLILKYFDLLWIVGLVEANIIKYQRHKMGNQRGF